MKIPAGNIWSGDKVRAVFTNPTELAYRKGNLRRHYPVMFRGRRYEDVEAIYQSMKMDAGEMLSFEELQALMTEAIAAKFMQYPILVATIKESGGEAWIKACSHRTFARTKSFKRWEGDGENSTFIRCLLAAYRIVQGR